MIKFRKIIYCLFYAFIFLFAIAVIVPLLPIPGNYQLLTVFSGSMEPKIHTGSVVVVKPAHSTNSGQAPLDSKHLTGQANYKIGDVITFGENGKTKTLITHRIHDIRVEKGNPIYITKGDANNAPDSKEVLPEEISGKVLFSIPFMGYAVSAAKKPFGFMLIIVIPAVIIIGDEIKKIGKEVKKMKEGKKEREKEEKEEKK